jgi:hypothetical protein
MFACFEPYTSPNPCQSRYFFIPTFATCIAGPDGCVVHEEALSYELQNNAGKTQHSLERHQPRTGATLL